jgi:tRNA(Ile)-lysidine synthase
MIEPEDTAIAKKFTRKVLDTIFEFDMIQKGTSVLVAVSGGPDSMALLHSLFELSDQLSLRLGVAHLNHCLRNDDSDSDEQFVRNTAKKYKLECFIEKLDIIEKQKKHRSSIEELGREARYSFFNKIAANHHFDKIAVGHHQGDNAELVLLYMLRGSGALGIGGIPPLRENIIRPLIKCTRKDILSYIELQQIDYKNDKSNLDTRFTRNRIRHELIPLLERNYNLKVTESLNRMSNILLLEESWIKELIAPLLDQATLSKSDKQIILNSSELLKLHIAPLRRVLREAITQVKGNLRRISFSHIDSLINLVNKNRPDSSLDFPDQIRVTVNSNKVTISKENENLRLLKTSSLPVSFELSVNLSDISPKQTVFIDKINVSIVFEKVNRQRIDNITTQESNIALLDWDKLSPFLIIRNIRKGDKFRPIGMKGNQKIKNFFINNKVSIRKRKRTPLLLSDGQIAWVAGFRISDAFKVTSTTTHVLKAEILFEQGVS